VSRFAVALLIGNFGLKKLEKFAKKFCRIKKKQ